MYDPISYNASNPSARLQVLYELIPFLIGCQSRKYISFNR